MQGAAAMKANDAAVSQPTVAFFNNATTAVAAKSSDVDREGWMKKVIEGAEQKRQISISTIGVIIALTLAIWNISGSIITAVRGDTKQEMEIQQLKDGMKEVRETQGKINDKLDLIQRQQNEVLSDKREQDAKIQGYKLGQSDGEKDHK